VKVVDRRWFTTEGDLREPLPERPPAEAPAAPQPAGEQPPDDVAEPASPARDEGPEASLHVPGAPGFLELVDTLAQPAVAFLSGQVPGRGKDLTAARFYIDLLAVLEEKTRGRLSLEEKNVLDDVLYQLRSLYVAASR